MGGLAHGSSLAPSSPKAMFSPSVALKRKGVCSTSRIARRRSARRKVRIHPVDQHAARIGIDQPHHQIRDGGFARARWPQHRAKLPTEW
jgi:hypothetical protein